MAVGSGAGGAARGSIAGGARSDAGQRHCFARHRRFARSDLWLGGTKGGSGFACGGRAALAAPRQAGLQRRIRDAVVGIVLGGEKAATIGLLGRQLMEQQVVDGGWSQNPYLPTDSYATGQTLFALSEAGILKPATRCIGGSRLSVADAARRRVVAREEPVAETTAILSERLSV